MGTINLDWNAVRPLNGSRQAGFEELCCQLADAERPRATTFLRKGTPDAGVECHAAFEDGYEWAWQAKYFNTLGNSQWAQLDDSVRTALDKHPQVVRYYVCIPLDLPDARLGERRSARERWDEHTKKWRGWAADRGMSVEFELWGSYQLLERLSRPENRGRLWFWFDVEGFDAEWFESRLKEALDAAGPRYTPEVHVELPIAARFEALGRTGTFFEGVKARARELRSKLRRLSYTAQHGDHNRDSHAGEKTDLGADDLAELVTAVADTTSHVLEGLSRLAPQPVGKLPFAWLHSSVDTALAASKPLGEALRKYERADDERANAGSSHGSRTYRQNPYRERRHNLYELEGELGTLREALEEADAFASASSCSSRGEQARARRISCATSRGRG